MTQPPRIALAHDWLCGYRGGEAVLEAVARVVITRFRPAGLYTMFDDGRPLAPAVDSIPRTVSPLGRLPAGDRLRRWLLPLYPRAVSRLSDRLQEAHAREPIDLVISTSSAAIKGLRPPPGVPHLCYCHSPARYLWSQTEEYGGGDLKGRLRGAGLRMFAPSLRRWDRATAANVTRFLANSTHTAREIRRCYGQEAEVVFPPVRTEFFTPAWTGGASRSRRVGDWLVAGALEPYKRVDLAIGASRLANHPLTIVGDGSQRKRLQRTAGPRVVFRGRVADEELRDLYRTSRVLLFPQIEDFGIAAAEAQACGLPVVARKSGGALDIVEPGLTGALFDKPTPESLLEAIGRAPEPTAAEQACRASAQRFSESRFETQLVAEIERLLSRH